VTPSGPDVEGAGPQDADRFKDGDSAPGYPHPGGDEGRDDLDASDDLPMRGWLPLEQRLWRHPSELASTGWPGASERALWPVGRSFEQTQRSQRPPAWSHARLRSAWGTAAIGVGAVATLAIGALMLSAALPSGSPPPADKVRTTSIPLATAPYQQVTRSVVGILATGSQGTNFASGVAIGKHGLVATTADLVKGATAFRAVLTNGKEIPARLVGVDPTSDVGVLQVEENLPVARFADDTSVHTGNRAFAVTLAPPVRHGATPTPVWSATTIESADAEVADGPAEGMSSIVAPLPAGSPDHGGILLRSDGSVIGILDPASASPAGGRVFLPADLVLGVSNDLATKGAVVHGWLGIEGQDVSGSDAPTGAQIGAEVVAVDPAGPAASLLAPGDVIEAVDGMRVHSMAELRSRLYTLPPDTVVRLSVSRRGVQITVDVELAAAP